MTELVPLGSSESEELIDALGGELDPSERQAVLAKTEGYKGVTGTISCAWNGYGKRHWKPASEV